MADLADIQRARATSRFTPPGHGPTAPLTDLQIHGQDIRRPLGLTRDLDPDRVSVRVNAPGTPWWEADVAAVRAAGARLVMLPKAERPEDLEALAPARVIALCETAAGILAAPRLAASPSCAALTWWCYTRTVGVSVIASLAHARV